MTGPTPSSSSSSPPACLLCGQPSSLLYPSTISDGAALTNDEVACTSDHLALYDDIYYCRSCALARSVLSVRDDELLDAYRDVEDPEYLVSEDERRRSFKDALGVIEQAMTRESPGALLEVGASAGLFLDEARSAGWSVVGIEPSRWAAETARARGLDVVTGTLDEFDSGGRRFDAVASWDVLEHFVDPVASVRRMAELLEPGGVLALTTVNIGGLGAKFFGRRWPWLMRMHLHYFTKASLGELVRREGFDIVEITSQPKLLKLGYTLDRARGHFGFIAGGARWLVDRLGLADAPVKIDFGDIIMIVARKREP